MRRLATLPAALTMFMLGCGRTPEPQKAIAQGPPAVRPGSFEDDVKFLSQHTPTVVLTSADGQSQVAVAPAYQGRVMTSTAAGAGGDSYGYIHRPGVEAGKRQPHMTVLGGEDRFWFGPEGGQYALYFPPGAAFDAEHWQVPEPIDWDAWPVASQSSTAAAFERDMSLTNHSGTKFSVRVNRTVRLLDAAAAAHALAVVLSSTTRVVAYETDNRITNTGSAPWKKETGLISIWILGMYRPSPTATVVIPVVPGSVAERGPIVNDAYFGKIDADRLRVGDGVVFFKGDGQKRGKIGIPRPRARNVAGSYDPDRRVLTIVTFTLPEATDYVNSMWARQQRPYAGDVVNSYNDGPMAPGAPPLGPFYEIESSSPAAALAPQQSLQHIHRTFHFQGSETDLDALARKVLGVSLAQIRASLATKIAS